MNPATNRIELPALTAARVAPISYSVIGGTACIYYSLANSILKWCNRQIPLR